MHLAIAKQNRSESSALLQQNVYLRYTGLRKLYSTLQVRSLAKLLRGYDTVHVHLFPAQLGAVLASFIPRDTGGPW